MSEFFKINIYIYIFIYMCCFVVGQNTENEIIMLKYKNKKLGFTLNKEDYVGPQLYQKIEADGLLNFSMEKKAAKNELDIALGNIVNFPPYDGDGSSIQFKAGDIVISTMNYYLAFFCYDTSYTWAVKLGKIEESSLDGFKSLLNDLEDGQKIDVTFSFWEPEQPESVLQKMITVIIVIISLTLFFIIFLLIQF